MFKFGQIEIASKEFNSQYQMTDPMDLEKIRVSEGFTANKHDTQYTIGYEIEPGKIIPSLRQDSERLYLSKRVAIQRELCVEDGL